MDPKNGKVIDNKVTSESGNYMFIGARTIKTGLAVTTTFLLCKLFRIEPAVFAAITAVVNMQNSVSKSLNNAWQQIGVHLLAATLSLIIGLLLGANPISIGLGVIVLILLCNRIGWSGGILLGIVSIIFILDSPPTAFLTHAFSRTLSIFLGLGVALVINRILAPPRYKTKLLNGLRSLCLLTSTYFLESLHTFIEAGNLTTFKKPDPQELNLLLDEVVALNEQAREEITVADNPRAIERRLEICRGFIERGQSINTMTAQRVKRRQQAYSSQELHEINVEFHGILNVLSVGKEKLAELIDTLTIAVDQNKSLGLYHEDLAYWETFDKAIDEWNRKVSGVFYLRALMEVSVVATELHWAARRTKALLNLLHK
jgi:uncharacterized membrane protein YgaE (UPF0421/DUF939 family)